MADIVVLLTFGAALIYTLTLRSSVSSSQHVEHMDHTGRC